MYDDVQLSVCGSALPPAVALASQAGAAQVVFDAAQRRFCALPAGGSELVAFIRVDAEIVARASVALPRLGVGAETVDRLVLACSPTAEGGDAHDLAYLAVSYLADFFDLVDAGEHPAPLVERARLAFATDLLWSAHETVVELDDYLPGVYGELAHAIAAAVADANVACDRAWQRVGTLERALLAAPWLEGPHLGDPGVFDALSRVAGGTSALLDSQWDELGALCEAFTVDASCGRAVADALFAAAVEAVRDPAAGGGSGGDVVVLGLPAMAQLWVPWRALLVIGAGCVIVAPRAVCGWASFPTWMPSSVAVVPVSTFSRLDPADAAQLEGFARAVGFPATQTYAEGLALVH